ncbi:MAG: Zinc finger type superfamily protein, partial [Frankiales bacterium]|nr:Zinc finger type superfamily protein [Frankiales bacterium]
MGNDTTKSYPAPGISVSFDSARCLHAAECARGLPAVFHPKEPPWITPASAPVADVIAVVKRCPSGALQ